MTTAAAAPAHLPRSLFPTRHRRSRCSASRHWSPGPIPASANATPTFGLAVQHVRLHDASVDFSDQSLVLPFAARVDAIDATLVGISNDPAQRADVQARGSIAPYGSATVTC